MSELGTSTACQPALFFFPAALGRAVSEPCTTASFQGANRWIIKKIKDDKLNKMISLG